ncbi:calcium-binding protein [Novosphingobium cyanobacteriorum]|uniref:Calcium-binding protein n=1 Tax=Novosphingobium cyanobacteriorum TaxID=3024215 RepID=A0ABT6CJU8_9SPHN|nr:calcium-binding protein [Novosphingobium cyanobacteriorum]MDF8333558.1 calcium-binding protein [Novosphingobium cyanobacteriorum]
MATIRGTAGKNVLTGGDADDLLFGLAGNDSLNGGAGDDQLDGGTSSDVMAGGEGNDTFVVDVFSDRIVELRGEGIDTVLTALKLLRLPANVENLAFTGDTPHAGFGNQLDNTITGRGGHDELHGGGGNDALNGAGGADYLWGGNGQDLLDGGTGADLMYGGSGNDVFVVDNLLDRTIENRPGGTDTVRSSVTLTLAANIENLELIGTRAVNGTGNKLDNMLTGNDARNTLSGGKGADTLNGEGGSDSLVGGLGADKFLFASPLAADNIDRILDFNQADGDRIVLDSTILVELSRGDLRNSAFLSGEGADRAAKDPQHIIYDTATGELSYDADGAGGRKGVVFAVVGLTDHPALTADDFIVI